MFVLKRPGTGIYEAEMPVIVGSVTTQNLVAGEILKVGDYKSG